MTSDRKSIWPDRLMIRDTGLHDDMGGAGQHIYTTAGQGYEKREYVRADLVADKKPQRCPAHGFVRHADCPGCPDDAPVTSNQRLTVTERLDKLIINIQTGKGVGAYGLGFLLELQEHIRKITPDETSDVPTMPIAGHAEHRFMLWLMKEMPAGTVIGAPTWWSPRIFRAVQRAIEVQDQVRPSPEEPAGKLVHDEECANCGAPWSKHLTNKLICPDAAIQDAYKFRQVAQVYKDLNSPENGNGGV